MNATQPQVTESLFDTLQRAIEKLETESMDLPNWGFPSLRSPAVHERWKRVREAKQWLHEVGRTLD